MERLLVMRMHTRGCFARASINGVNVGMASDSAGTVCLPVHEFLIDGVNELGLTIGSGALGGENPPKQVWAEELVGAQLRLLLPRMGQLCSELAARTVAEFDWATEPKSVFSAPFQLVQHVDIPIKFPRWRWLDAPVVTDLMGIRPLVVDFLQAMVINLLRGDSDAFLSSNRLRLEELSVAYQQPLVEVINKLRARLHLLYATKLLQIPIPTDENVQLRSCAGGRLIECLSRNGEPLIQTIPSANGEVWSWPLRLAVINGRCHILR